MQTFGKHLLIASLVGLGTIAIAYIVNAGMNYVSDNKLSFTGRTALFIFLTVLVLYLILEYTGLHKKFCQANY